MLGRHHYARVLSEHERACVGCRVGPVLGVSLLGERVAAVDDQPDHREHRDDPECQQDQDLAGLMAFAVW